MATIMDQRTKTDRTTRDKASSWEEYNRKAKEMSKELHAIIESLERRADRMMGRRRFFF